jgi:hypothetical protein
MSYILEALKKAEQKSEKGGLPSLLSHPRATDRKNGRMWFYPLIAALFLNAGMIFWWVHPWWPNEPQTIVQAPAVHPQASVAPAEPLTKIREPNRSNNLQEVPREMRVTAGRARRSLIRHSKDWGYRQHVGPAATAPGKKGDAARKVA